MPQNIGTASVAVNLDLRNAQRQYAAFQRQLNSAGRQNNVFSSISSDAKDFENSLGKATNRVVAFASAAAVFGTLAKTAQSFAQSIIEVDNSLAKINVNLGQSADSLKEFGAQVFNVARQTGQTFEVAAKAAEELARQGLGAEDTIDRLQKALILSRIAGLDSAEAVNTLTAAINSFNESALSAGEIVNKFAAVDTKFAVSSKDLAEAVSRVGSTAQEAGVGIDQLIGLVTSLQQTTQRGGATIGNGLKTIFTRIQSAPETINALESVGVAIKNTDGSLRDAVSILRDYAAARDKVGEVERQALDRTVAGGFQINVLKAAVADLTKEYSIYGAAVKTSTNATDEAIQKNEQLNQTLSSLINSTTVSIKQLFATIGSENVGPILGTILKYFEKARAFFSGDSGSDLGKSLGQGLIKGISAVISGPVLGALLLVVGNAFKKVLVTIAQEASTLLKINGIVAARANAQKEINILTAQANNQERVQLALATSTLQVYEALLAVKTRIAQEQLAGTPLTNLVARKGGFIGKGIPGFADPIQSAIGREAAATGLPTNQIYVDRDARVATFGNPMGLLVANRRDEPLGGYQGVNRVLSEGGNPKTNGIPGFAAPFSRQSFISRGQFVPQETVDAINKLLQSMKGLDSGRIKTVATELNKLTEGFNKSAKGLVTGARLTLQRVARAGEGRIVGAGYAESPEEVRRATTGNQYVIPPLGTNTPPLYSSPNKGVFGPSFPINPAFAKQLAQKADEDAAIRSAQAIEDAFNRSQARRRAQAAGIVQRRQTIQNRTLAASFALPLIGGFAEPAIQGLGFSTKGGTGGGILQGALSYGTSAAGVGALSGNPVVAGVAGAAGALVGIFSKLSKTAEELDEELNKAAQQRNEEGDAIQHTLTLREQLKDAQEGGQSQSVLLAIKDQLAASDARVSSPRGRAVLNAGSSDQAEAQRQYEQADRLDDAASNLARILSGGATGKISGTIRRGLNSDLVGGLTAEDKAALRRASSDAFDYSAIKAARGGKTEVTQEDEDKAFAEYQAVLKEITPTLEKFHISLDQVNEHNLPDLSQGITNAVVTFKKRVDELNQKQAQPAGLLRGAFTSPVDSGALRQSAFTGRNPYLFTQNQRGQSQFGFFNSLISAGAFDEKQLEEGQFASVYKKSKAISQSDNLNKLILDYVRQALGSSSGEYTDFRGEPIPSALRGALSGLSKRNGQAGQQASVLLDLLDKGQNTRTNAGVKPLPVLLNSLAVGTSYSTYAGSGRGADGRIKVNPYGLANDYEQRARDREAAKAYLDAHTPIGGHGAVTVTGSAALHRKAPAGNRNSSIKDDTLGNRDQITPVTATVNVNVNGSVESVSDAGIVDKITSAIAQIITKGLESNNVTDQVIQAILQKLGVPVPKPVPPGPKMDLDANLPSGPVPVVSTR